MLNSQTEARILSSLLHERESKMIATTLLLIGDEEIPRLGLGHLLASESIFEVRGKGGSKDAVALASKLKPDVVILFADTASPSCAQLVGSIHLVVPRSGIVVLGRETHHSYVGMLLAAGALGYVLLRASPRELFTAILAASHHRRYIDPNLSSELFELLALQAEGGTKVLSRREEQVVRMLAFGHTLKEISLLLNVSVKSIETYRARTREKLGLETRADIVRYAREMGMFHGELDSVFKLGSGSPLAPQIPRLVQTVIAKTRRPDRPMAAVPKPASSFGLSVGAGLAGD